MRFVLRRPLDRSHNRRGRREGHELFHRRGYRHEAEASVPTITFAGTTVISPSVARFHKSARSFAVRRRWSMRSCLDVRSSKHCPQLARVQIAREPPR